MTDVCNYADHTTFHPFDLHLKSFIIVLEHDAPLAMKWFESNYMNLIQDRCNFLFSGHLCETLSAKIRDIKIWESKEQEHLVVLIDRDLKFDEFVLSQCQKARKILSTLIRISKFWKLFVWVFSERQTNARINHIHKRALWAVYDDEIGSYNLELAPRIFMNLIKFRIAVLRRLDMLLDYGKFNGGKSNNQGYIDFSDAAIGVSNEVSRI